MTPTDNVTVSDEAVEAAARAICVSRGLNPDTLYEDLHGEYPADEPSVAGSSGKHTFYRAWRKQVPHARAALAAAFPALVAQLEASTLAYNAMVPELKQRAEAAERELELERLRGITPGLHPRAPAGVGIPRYGIRWNGPTEPLSVPMDDGYWTPWHLAQARIAELERQRDADAADARRYRWLRARELDTIVAGGVFAGKTPENVVINGGDLDAAIDATIAAGGEGR